MSAMLQIADLHIRFGDKQVLKGLNLSVPEHSIFGFIGKNGAGKTTTMKTVLGLLKPDAGKILVAGESVVYGQTATNRHIGYLPDVPEFYSFMTAAEYLAFCGDITGMTVKDCKTRSAELLDLVGLSGERHRIRGFSRGMKQRLGIAQALLNRPALLICDEPTSALDPAGRKEILDILLAAREQTTVLFSTHILSDVERICTDVAFLDDGHIRLQGKLAEIRERYRTDDYLIETCYEQDADRLLELFPQSQGSCSGSSHADLSLRPANRLIRRTGPCQLIFSDNQKALFTLLRFVADQEIPLLRAERMEPSLESLFLEVP